jgi:predicted amidohydrolase
MLMIIRVAGAQLPVTNDINANVAAIERAIAFARHAGADILLTPEGSLSGYTHQFNRRAAVEALEHVTRQAAEARIGLAIGTCYVEPEGDCCNEIRFYDRGGSQLGFHTKVLRCGSLEDSPVGEINDYGVRPLRSFDFHGTTIGGLICNDLWANPTCTPMPDPHLTQKLSRMGARIVFHAVNGGRDGSDWSKLNWQFHEANLRMRAAAGRLWIVTVDNCHPVEFPCSSPSGVIAPDGRWACRTDPVGEQFFQFPIPLEPRSPQ